VIDKETLFRQYFKTVVLLAEFSLSKTAIYEKLKELMVSEFKLDADSISPEKCLDDDLQLDSLDMVDLTLSLSDYLREKLDPSLFKDAGTVQDLVDSVTPLWKSDL
jgi:acyl carrier protein